MNLKRSVQAVCAIVMAGLVTGCTTGGIVASAQGTPANNAASGFVPNAAAGVPVAPTPLARDQIVVMKSFGARANPFALLPQERVYERDQKAANIFNRIGGWSFYYEEPVVVEQPIEFEEQPYRRLAGVLIGESVTALIDMGDGRLQRIRPGMTIQGTDWMVVSIDEDNAVLRRIPAAKNKRPYEVVVRLESDPRGAGGGGGGGNRPGGGQPGGSGQPAQFDDR